jgi:hypothetical protein
MTVAGQAPAGARERLVRPLRRWNGAATSPVVLQATRGRVVSAEHGFCRHLEREAEPLLSREFPMALKDPTNAGHVSQLPVGGGIACP